MKECKGCKKLITNEEYFRDHNGACSECSNKNVPKDYEGFRRFALDLTNEEIDTIDAVLGVKYDIHNIRCPKCGTKDCLSFFDIEWHDDDAEIKQVECLECRFIMSKEEFLRLRNT